VPHRLSLTELQQAYLDLQSRVTQFSAKEQELINVRDMLDQELLVYKRFNAFHSAALDVHDVPALLELIAETAVDVFETELGYARFEPESSEAETVAHLEGAANRERAAMQQAIEAWVDSGEAPFECEVGGLKQDEPLSHVLVARKRLLRSGGKLQVVAAVSKERQGTFGTFTPKTQAVFKLFVESCMAYLENLLSANRISEQLETIRRSELELRRLSLIATQTNSGVIITDTHGCIEWVNEAFLRNTGYSFEEVIGLKPKDFLQVEGWNDAAIMNKLSSALAAKEPVSLALKNRKKSGKEFYIQLSITPVFDQAHNHVNFIAIQQDITAEKRNEQRLLEQNEELTKINQELDQFVYSTSHDLRSPLLAIQGLLDLLHIDQMGSPEKEYLSMVSESIARLDSTILEILNYSRNARMDVAWRSFNLRSALEVILQDLATVNSDIVVNVDWKGEDEVILDEMRVGIVLKNILSNAVKYSKKGSESPFVHVEVDTRLGACLMRVTDNGEGIPSEHIAKIFDMFFRATTTSTGTGLGLYIVKEVVDKLGGSIDLDSTLGEGTTVTVTLPQSLHE
jgi:PAS domain S-box-containing protein